MTGYISGVIGFMAFAAWRTPDNRLGPTLFLAAIWPVIVPFVIAVVILDKFGITLDLDQSKQMFGARKATNPNIKGFAFTVLFLEFRVFKEIA